MPTHCRLLYTSTEHLDGHTPDTSDTLNFHLAKFKKKFITCPTCSSQFTYLYQNTNTKTKFLHCRACSAQNSVKILNSHEQKIFDMTVCGKNQSRPRSNKSVTFDPVTKVSKIYTYEQISRLEKVHLPTTDNPFLAIFNMLRQKFIRNINGNIIIIK